MGAYSTKDFTLDKPFSLVLFVKELTIHTGCEVILFERNSRLEQIAIQFEEIKPNQEEGLVLELHFPQFKDRYARICDMVFDRNSFYFLFMKEQIKCYTLLQAIRVTLDMGFEPLYNDTKIIFPKWIDKKWEEIPWWYFVKP